jgi:hypothetical protein
MPVSDLQSGLHLNPISVQYLDPNGQAHTVRRPVHQVPHYTFGRLIGFEDISLYLLFPRLYRENQQSSRLLDQDFKQWMDDILLPIINRCHSGDLIQHYPSSFDHSRLNATARGVEMRSQRVDPVAREQRLFYFLPPEALTTVWEQILEATQRPGFHQFQDLKILIEGKNLKTLTKAHTLANLIEGFQQHWQNAVHDTYLSEPFFYDIGKETCPTAVFEPSESQPQTLLWRRCCLDAYSQWIHSKQPPDAPHALQRFYPISMLEDTGSLTLETRRSAPHRQAGLFYSQFYASVKEVFAAGNIYPFTNSGVETLALDPKLRKTWQTVGGGLSHNPIALNRAYLTTKQRCHAALQGSIQKVFGLREEHRVSRTLFDQIMREFQDRGQFTTPFPRIPDSAESFYALPTSTLLRWFRWNINKFCVGFEMVYSLNDRHFVTWEHTRMMLMFLRCLPFSYSGGLLERVSGCWRDVWFRPDPTQPDGLRRCEGLGFQRNMQQSGYGWFLDKIDWEMMVFRQPFAQHMMFNSPSMQSAYHARYPQVQDVRIDFIRVDQARQWMVEFSSIPPCQEYLEKYLRQLCLRAFRKDVFAQIKPFLREESMVTALAGDTPLCWPSVNQALQEQYRPPYIAGGNRMAVKSVDVLFTWLWEWRDGRLERKGWKEKPYRMLYQQSFEIITLIRGKDAARAWKKKLQTSFIRSHWLLPYPQNHSFMRKSKEAGQVMWWSSVHCGLDRYYRRLSRYGPLPRPLPAFNIKHHPEDHWERSRPFLDYMDYTVQPEQRLVHLSEADLYRQLQSLQLTYNNQAQPRGIRAADPSPPIYDIPDIIGYHMDRDPQGPMEGWNMTTCTGQIRKALEEYEIRQHYQQNLRCLRQRPSRPDDCSDSQPEPETGHDREDEMTSDEESLEQQQLQRVKYIQQIETQMYKCIGQDRKLWQQSGVHNPIIKLYAPQLRRLPHHEYSILPLLDLKKEPKQQPVAFYTPHR